MTRAEILNCLTDRPCDSCKFHESGRCERWDCVFEEKPDGCEDAISRQAAKKALEDRFMELQKRHSEDRYETNFCLNTILELPSVTPKQKVGCWIHTDECDEEWQYRCSICNMPSRSNAHRYCSKCGSYMYGIEPDDAEDCEDKRMTREEAIKALQYERKTALHENKGAFDMAIKALSAEPEKMSFDGMTNGEVIYLLFPNMVIYHNIDFTLKEMIFSDEWWDAPYKEERSEKE